MDFHHAVELKDFLQDAGYEAELYDNYGYEAELYDNYSGRGMYGRTTTGVTADVSPAEMEMMREELENVEIDPPYRSDNMGLDYIYY